MKAFTFQAPPNILFEAGASRKLAEVVAGYGVTRVLLVTDKGVRNAGLTKSEGKPYSRLSAGKLRVSNGRCRHQCLLLTAPDIKESPAYELPWSSVRLNGQL